MWRAIVMAIGISLCILGGEFMVVDRLVMADDTPNLATSPYADGTYMPSSSYRSLGTYSSLGSSSERVFIPPEWAPWGAMSAGVLTVLYAAAIPRG